MIPGWCPVCEKRIRGTEERRAKHFARHKEEGGPLSARSPRRPTLAQLIRWESQGICEATDGCTVEPDGTCPHGRPSWLLEEGLI